MSTKDADRFLNAVASGFCTVDCTDQPTCPLYGLQPLVFDPNSDTTRCGTRSPTAYVSPKTELNNLCQQRKIKVAYRSHTEDGFFVSTVLVGGESFESSGFRNRRSAETAAAEMALSHFSEQPPPLSRDGHSIEPIFSGEPDHGVALPAVQADDHYSLAGSECGSSCSDWCEVVERSEAEFSPCCPEMSPQDIELAEANSSLRDQNLSLRDRLRVELVEEARAKNFHEWLSGTHREREYDDPSVARFRNLKANNAVLHFENAAIRQRLDGIEPTLPRSDEYVPYAGYTHSELCTENAMLRKQLHEKTEQIESNFPESTFVRMLNSLSETKAGQARVQEKLHHAKVEADDNIAIITQKIDGLARNKVANIRSKLDQMKLQFDKIKTELKEARAGAESSSNKCVEWKGRFDELKADRDSLRWDNTHMQSENIAITAELGRLTEELDELREKASQQEEAGNKLSQERDSMVLGLGQLRADCDRHKATLGERLRELDVAHARIVDVEAENKTLNEQRSFVDSCIRDQSQQIKDLKARAKESPENVQQFTMLLDVIRDGDRERDALKAEIASLLEKQRKDADTVAALRLQNKIYHDDFMSERRERQRAQDHTKFDQSSPATKSASNELQKFIFGADTVVDGPYQYLQCPKCKAIFDQADLSKFDEHIARCI